jgi:RHS repeat-associated protein
MATLPVVISDTEAVYLYGLDIIAQQQSERLYYVHDGLGSVRQLLDTTGQIETNYAYDPFGVPLVEGEVYNPYQYTGEAWDTEVELLYLRARYYQPEVGRFITKDPWVGLTGRPGTLNPYPYVTSNPINRIDPGGLDGGEPGGICPECKERLHGADLEWLYDWFSDEEPDIWDAKRPCAEEYHEWVLHWDWPDPWGGEELGSVGDELIPPLREVLADEAERMYEEGLGITPKNLGTIALSRQNNPLTRALLDAGCRGGITVRTIANWLQPPFNLLMEAFWMDDQQQTNYEPYFLTLLMSENEADLSDVQQSAVYPWWCDWLTQFGTEPEEFFHPVVAE